MMAGGFRLQPAGLQQHAARHQQAAAGQSSACGRPERCLGGELHVSNPDNGCKLSPSTTAGQSGACGGLEHRLGGEHRPSTLIHSFDVLCCSARQQNAPHQMAVPPPPPLLLQLLLQLHGTGGMTGAWARSWAACKWGTLLTNRRALPWCRWSQCRRDAAVRGVLGRGMHAHWEAGTYFLCCCTPTGAGGADTDGDAAARGAGAVREAEGLHARPPRHPAVHAGA